MATKRTKLIDLYKSLNDKPLNKTIHEQAMYGTATHDNAKPSGVETLMVKLGGDEKTELKISNQTDSSGNIDLSNVTLEFKDKKYEGLEFKYEDDIEGGDHENEGKDVLFVAEAEDGTIFEVEVNAEANFDMSGEIQDVEWRSLETFPSKEAQRGEISEREKVGRGKDPYACKTDLDCADHGLCCDNGRCAQCISFEKPKSDDKLNIASKMLEMKKSDLVKIIKESIKKLQMQEKLSLNEVEVDRVRGVNNINDYCVGCIPDCCNMYDWGGNAITGYWADLACGGCAGMPTGTIIGPDGQPVDLDNLESGGSLNKGDFLPPQTSTNFKPPMKMKPKRRGVNEGHCYDEDGKPMPEAHCMEEKVNEGHCYDEDGKPMPEAHCMEENIAESQLLTETITCTLTNVNACVNYVNACLEGGGYIQTDPANNPPVVINCINETPTDSSGGLVFRSKEDFADFAGDNISPKVQSAMINSRVVIHDPSGKLKRKKLKSKLMERFQKLAGLND